MIFKANSVIPTQTQYHVWVSLDARRTQVVVRDKVNPVLLQPTGSSLNQRPVNREEPESSSPVTQRFTVHPTSFTPSVDTLWPVLPPEVNAPGSCAYNLWQYFVGEVSDQLWLLDRTNITRRLNEESMKFIDNLVLVKGSEYWKM